MRFVKKIVSKRPVKSTEIVYDSPKDGKPIEAPVPSTRLTPADIKPACSVAGPTLTGSTPNFILKNEVNQYFVNETKDKTQEAGDVYFRASGLFYMCPREEVLSSVHKVPRVETIDAKLAAIFELGHVVHYWLQNKVFANKLMGLWKCKKCKHVHGTQDKIEFKPLKCVKCGSEDIEYVETYYKDDLLHYGGHPDGFVFDFGELCLVDFKTASTEAYTGIDRWGVNEAYIWQANGYMYLTGVKMLKLIFFNKNESVFKEKIIRRDESIIEQIKKKCLDAAYGIESVKGGEFFLPERICKRKADARAKNCSMCNICFDKYDKEENFTKIAV